MRRRRKRRRRRRKSCQLVSIPKKKPSACSLYARTGYWLNVTGDMGWVLRAHAPAHPLAASVNAMYSFQGLPTLFGNPECNEEIECPRTEVGRFVDLYVPFLSRTCTTVKCRFSKRQPCKFCEDFSACYLYSR